jgi:serine/threonine protein kinase
VMIASDGAVKLMDLGIARGIEGDSITRASSILGTAGYLSPEQARGERVDHRSDIYSLGCVLYEMLTGRQPFEADTPVAVAYKHVHEAPVPPTTLDPSIPVALEAVTLRAMEKDPAARFPQVAEMTAALEDVTAPAPPVQPTRPLPATATESLPATAPVTAQPTTPLPRRADRPPRRRRMVPLLAVIVVLVLLGALAFALFGDDTPGDRATDRPTRSASPTRSPSASSSAGPSPIDSIDSVDEARDAVFAILGEGISTQRITTHAAEEIEHGVDHALEEFDDGEIDKAIEELEKLKEKVDGFIDHDEIANSMKQKLLKAIDDLAEQLMLAADEEGD